MAEAICSQQQHNLGLREFPSGWEPKPMLQRGSPHPLTIHTVGLPQYVWYFKFCKSIKERESTMSALTCFSLSLQSPFKLHICKIGLFSNTCTQYTQQSQKSSNTAWRKENLLSKPQPQSDGVSQHSRLRQEHHEIEASLTLGIRTTRAT